MAIKGVNFISGPSYAYLPEEEEKRDGFLRTAANIGVDTLQGAGDLARGTVGLVGLIPGAHHFADPLAEGIGSATDWVGEKLHSDQWLREEAEINRAGAGLEDDFLGQMGAKLGAFGDNPWHIPGAIGRALPGMYGSASFARNLLGRVAPKASAATAGQVGEAGFAAGLAGAEIAHEEEGSGYGNRAMALPIGLTTGLIARGANRVMPDVGDIETAMAGGIGGVVREGKPMNLLSRTFLGGVKEGFLEEAPQSFMEAGLQNVALNRPFMENTGAAVGEGLVVGTPMGAGYSGLFGGRPQQDDQGQGGRDAQHLLATRNWNQHNLSQRTMEFEGGEGVWPRPRDPRGDIVSPEQEKVFAFQRAEAQLQRVAELMRRAQNDDRLLPGLQEEYRLANKEAMRVWNSMSPETQRMMQAAEADTFDQTGQQELFVDPSELRQERLFDEDGTTVADAQQQRAAPGEGKRARAVGQAVRMYDQQMPPPAEPLRAPRQRTGEAIPLTPEGRAASPLPQGLSGIPLLQWKEENGIELTPNEQRALSEDRVANWTPGAQQQLELPEPSRARPEQAGPVNPNAPISRVSRSTGQQEIRFPGDEDRVGAQPPSETPESAEGQLFRALSVGDDVMVTRLVKEAGRQLKRGREAERAVKNRDINTARELMRALDAKNAQAAPETTEQAEKAQQSADRKRLKYKKAKIAGYEDRRNTLVGYRDATLKRIKRVEAGARITGSKPKTEEMKAKVRKQRAAMGEQTRLINETKVGARTMPTKSRWLNEAELPIEERAIKNDAETEAEMKNRPSLTPPVSVEQFDAMGASAKKVLVFKDAYNAWRRGWIDSDKFEAWLGYIEKGNYQKVRKEYGTLYEENSADAAAVRSQVQSEIFAEKAETENRENKASPPLSVGTGSTFLAEYLDALEALENADEDTEPKLAKDAEIALANLISIAREGKPLQAAQEAGMVPAEDNLPPVQSVTAEAIAEAQEILEFLRDKGKITDTMQRRAEDRAGVMDEGAGEDRGALTATTNAAVDAALAKLEDSNFYNEIREAAKSIKMGNRMREFIASAIKYFDATKMAYKAAIESRSKYGGFFAMLTQIDTPPGWTTELLQRFLATQSNTVVRRHIRTALDKNIARGDPTSTSVKESKRPHRLTAAILRRIVTPDPLVEEGQSAAGVLKEWKRRRLEALLTNAVGILNTELGATDGYTTQTFIQAVARGDSLTYRGSNPYTVSKEVADEVNVGEEALPRFEVKKKQDIIDEAVRLLNSFELGLREKMAELRDALGGRKPRGRTVAEVEAAVEATSDTYNDSPRSLIDRDVQERAAKTLSDAMRAKQEGRVTDIQKQKLADREQTVSLHSIPYLVALGTRDKNNKRLTAVRVTMKDGVETISTTVKTSDGRIVDASVSLKADGTVTKDSLKTTTRPSRTKTPPPDDFQLEIAEINEEIARIDADHTNWNKDRTVMRPLAKVEIKRLQAKKADVLKAIRYNKIVDAAKKVQNNDEPPPDKPRGAKGAALKKKAATKAKAKNAKFSQGSQSTEANYTPTTIEKINGAISALFTKAADFTKLVTIVESADDPRLPAQLRAEIAESEKAGKRVQAATHDGRVYLISNGIPQGAEAGIFLHEVGVHIGLESLLDKATLTKLANVVRQWANEPGTRNQKLAQRALDKAAASTTTKPDVEIVAYMVEELVNAGVRPSLTVDTTASGWLGKIERAIKLILTALKLDPAMLTQRNFVDLAYGAALLSPTVKVVGKGTSFSQAAGALADRIGANPVKAQVADLARRGAMHLMFGHQLARYAEKLGLSSVGEYFKAMSRKNKTKVSLSKRVEDLATLFSNLPDDAARRKLNRYLNEARRDGKWGYKPSWLTNEQFDELSDQESTAAYAALTPAQQELARKIFEFTHEMRERKYAALNKEIDAEYKERLKAAKTPEAREAAEKERKSAIAAYGVRESMTQGPYVPFKRFGDIVIVAQSAEFQNAKEQGDTKRVRELKSDPDHYWVEMADDARKADVVRQRLAAKFGEENVYDTVKEDSRSIYGEELPFHFVKRIRKMTQDEFGETSDAAKMVNRLMSDLYVSMLHDERGRKSELEAFMVAGEEQDTMRSFVAQGMADAHLIASLEGNEEVMNHLQTMRDQKKAKPGEKGVPRARVYNEVMKRHAAAFAFDNPLHWQEKAMSITSFWMLTTSPSYWLTNFLQTPTMTLPVLAGRFSFNKAWGTWLSTANEIRKLDLDKFDAAVIGKNEGEQKMLTELYERGRIDITLAMDLGRLVRDGTLTKYGLFGKPGEVTQTAIERITRIPHHVEMFNRVSSALAAYRLAVQSGKYTPEQAMEYADTVVIDTHGDYSGTNAPRIMMQGAHPGLPIKIMTQFRKFQLIQIGYMAKLVQQSLKGATPEERKAARWALTYVVGSLGTMAGGLGIPFGYTLAAILFAAGDLGGDDDEPKIGLRAIGPFATEADRLLIEDRIRAAVKDPDVAMLITRGLPAMMGVDMSGSIGAGLAGQIFPFAKDADTPTEKVANTLMAMSGPFIGGFVPRVLEGFGDVANGDYSRGMVKLMPKGIGSVIEAGRLQSEGFVDRNGVHLLTPEEIGSLGILGRGLGFQASAVSDRFARQKILDTYEQFFNDRAKQIKMDFLEARRSGASTAEASADWRELQQARAKFGFKKNPQVDLVRQVRSVAKRERKARDGVIVSDTNKKFFDRYE